LQHAILTRDRHTFGTFDPLRGRRFPKGDEREVVWAECKKRASSGDQPDKCGFVVWVITLMYSGGEDVLETKAGLQKHEGRLFSGRFDNVEHRHAIPAQNKY
jgi:hypothetical protein